jgi:hypothetical protein
MIHHQLHLPVLAAGLLLSSPAFGGSGCELSGLAIQVWSGPQAGIATLSARTRSREDGVCQLDLGAVKMNDSAGRPVPILMAMALVDGIPFSTQPGVFSLQLPMRSGQERLLQWRLFSEPLSSDRQPPNPPRSIELQQGKLGLEVAPGAPVQITVEVPRGLSGKAFFDLTSRGDSISWDIPAPSGLAPRGVLSGGALPSLRWEILPGGVTPPGVPDSGETFELLRLDLAQQFVAALTAPGSTAEARAAAWDLAFDRSMSALLSVDTVTAILGAQIMSWLVSGLRLDPPGVRDLREPSDGGRTPVPERIATAVRAALSRPDRSWMMSDTPPFPANNGWLARLAPPSAYEHESRDGLARLNDRLAKGSFRPVALGAAGTAPTPLLPPLSGEIAPVVPALPRPKPDRMGPVMSVAGALSLVVLSMLLRLRNNRRPV